MKKLLSLLLAFAMVLGSASIAVADAATTTKTEYPESEWTEVTYMLQGSALRNEEEPANLKEFARRTGTLVKLNYITEDQQSVRMASGDLGCDLFFSGADNTTFSSLVDGGLIHGFTREELEKSCPNMLANAGKMVDWMINNRGFGSNLFYLFSGHVQTGLQDLVPYHEMNIAPFVRWDYYKELGYPEIHNEDEFLAMLKKMQDLHPTTADGKKTYAITATLNGLWSISCCYAYFNNYQSECGWYTALTNFDEQSDATDPNYTLWDALRYYNKAYNLGILDPESFTQKGENVDEKINNGQSFYTENCWNNYNINLAQSVGPDAGFEPILTAFKGLRNEFYWNADESDVSYTGWHSGFTISANTQNLDACLKLIDYLYTPEGSRLAYNGIEGEDWEYNTDGIPVKTQEYIDKCAADEEYKKWDRGCGLFNEAIGMAEGVLTGDGYPADIAATKYAMIANNTALDTEYCKYYGVEFPTQLAIKLANDGTVKTCKFATYSADYDKQPDDVVRILTKCDDYVLKMVPSVVMAPTADVDGMINSMITELQSYGLQTVVDWWHGQYDTVKAARAAQTK